MRADLTFGATWSGQLHDQSGTATVSTSFIGMVHLRTTDASMYAAAVMTPDETRALVAALVAAIEAAEAAGRAMAARGEQ